MDHLKGELLSISALWLTVGDFILNLSEVTHFNLGQSEYGGYAVFAGLKNDKTLAVFEGEKEACIECIKEIDSTLKD